MAIGIKLFHIIFCMKLAAPQCLTYFILKQVSF